MNDQKKDNDYRFKKIKSMISSFWPVLIVPIAMVIVLLICTLVCLVGIKLFQ